MTSAPHQFDPSVLREYDIRGIVDETLTAKDAFALGQAFGTKIIRKGGDKVCVGYDGRKSSPIYAKALIEGLTSTGVNVEDIGLGPSPMLYFAVKSRKSDGGIMITGSHNPSNYNGFKMLYQDASVFGDEIQEIGQIVANADFETGQGTVSTIDIQDSYVDRLLQDLKPDINFKIVWDNGNGAAGEILRRMVAKLPGEHILLYDEIDGTFPNHHADPTVDENLSDLIRAVAEHKASFGIGFDGDGDRIGVVDEHGGILRCDNLIAIYAKDILSRHAGAAIVGDVKCSQVMFDEITRLGGKPVMWNTGHSLVKSKMVEENAPLAGELSGHIFFKDGYYGYDDALYCAIRLMNAVHDSGAPLSKLSEHLPVLFNTPEFRVEVDEDQKFTIVPQIIENLRANNTSNYDINDIDGVRVTTPNGWWLLRPSNTQNVLSGRVEANSNENLEDLKTMVKECVQSVGYDITF